MDQFLLCNPVSSLSFWTYAFLSTFSAVLAAIFVFTAIRSRGQGLFTFDPHAKALKIRGPVVYAVFSVVLFALILGLSWIDHKLELDITPYAQKMDLKAGERLGSIHDRYASRSSRTILLSEGVEDVIVTGTYDGSCTAAMFYKICLRTGLSCTWSDSESLMRISKPG